MKRIVFLFALAFVMLGINAQEQGKIRAGLDAGYAVPKGGGGATFGVELKYNLLDNWNVGARWEAAFLAKTINSGLDAEVAVNNGYLLTTDYYFNNGNSRFAPFIGGGVGLYSLAALKVETDGYDPQKIGGGKSNKVGALARAGFEYSRFRMTFAYNFIPSSKYDGSDINTDLLKIDNISVNNSYFSFAVGFYLGGGSWKKN